MNHIVGTLGTEKKQAIKVNIKEWNGLTYVDIRTHYTGSDNAWYPTKKGLFVCEDKISELITLLEQAEMALKSKGRIDAVPIG